MDQTPPRSDAQEPDRLSAPAQHKLPRKQLGRTTRLLLIGLRIYVLIAVPIVAYAFIHALTAGHP